MNDVASGIAVFVTAVEAGGFSAAAARLNLSRSAVGKTVARLEARLGVTLFHRTTRAQSLTDDGQAYYERCFRALEELRAAEAMLDSGRRHAVGRLRVSVPVLFGRRCVAPVLTRLAMDHPGLNLDLSFSDRLVDLVEDGFDLAVRNGPLDNATGLMQRRVARQRMTVCASPGYLDEHGAPSSLDDLCNHHAVTYGRAGRVRSWLFPQKDGKPLAITPPSRMRFDDLGALSDAAVAGFGLAWLPCWLIRDLAQAGTLVPLFTDLPQLVFDSHAIWPHASKLPLRVRLGIDALAAALPGRAEL